MTKYFLYILFALCVFSFSYPAKAKEKSESKCEFWVTFFNLDKKKNYGGHKLVADYIENNNNISVISEGNFELKSFYNYCLDIVDNDANAEFDAFNTFFQTIPKSTGLVTIKVKDGPKATFIKR